eukprot:TRINITY_DN59133_c0_g1_i1.p1 TRINITY_DN59133_c0_g1~~TRINITY_DN59133_c0_g1_i1.p1  ORF type:complete len:131 (-),score=14.37 TRINITY_DN59133_c0_g1_i1:107-499(-)
MCSIAGTPSGFSFSPPNVSLSAASSGMPRRRPCGFEPVFDSFPILAPPSSAACQPPRHGAPTSDSASPPSLAEGSPNTRSPCSAVATVATVPPAPVTDAARDEKARCQKATQITTKQKRRTMAGEVAELY